MNENIVTEFYEKYIIDSTRIEKFQVRFPLEVRDEVFNSLWASKFSIKECTIYADQGDIIAERKI